MKRAFLSAGLCCFLLVLFLTSARVRGLAQAAGPATCQAPASAGVAFVACSGGSPLPIAGNNIVVRASDDQQLDLYFSNLPADAVVSSTLTTAPTISSGHVSARFAADEIFAAIIVSQGAKTIETVAVVDIPGTRFTPSAGAAQRFTIGDLAGATSIGAFDISFDGSTLTFKVPDGTLGIGGSVTFASGQPPKVSLSASIGVDSVAALTESTAGLSMTSTAPASISLGDLRLSVVRASLSLPATGTPTASMTILPSIPLVPSAAIPQLSLAFTGAGASVVCASDINVSLNVAVDVPAPFQSWRLTLTQLTYGCASKALTVSAYLIPPGAAGKTVSFVFQNGSLVPTSSFSFPLTKPVVQQAYGVSFSFSSFGLRPPGAGAVPATVTGGIIFDTTLSISTAIASVAITTGQFEAAFAVSTAPALELYADCSAPEAAQPDASTALVLKPRCDGNNRIIGINHDAGQVIKQFKVGSVEVDNAPVPPFHVAEGDGFKIDGPAPSSSPVLLVAGNSLTIDGFAMATPPPATGAAPAAAGFIVTAKDAVLRFPTLKWQPITFTNVAFPTDLKSDVSIGTVSALSLAGFSFASATGGECQHEVSFGGAGLTICGYLAGPRFLASEMPHKSVTLPSSANGVSAASMTDETPTTGEVPLLSISVSISSGAPKVTLGLPTDSELSCANNGGLYFGPTAICVNKAAYIQAPAAAFDIPEASNSFCPNPDSAALAQDPSKDGEVLICGQVTFIKYATESRRLNFFAVVGKDGSGNGLFAGGAEANPPITTAIAGETISVSNMAIAMTNTVRDFNVGGSVTVKEFNYSTIYFKTVELRETRSGDTAPWTGAAPKITLDVPKTSESFFARLVSDGIISMILNGFKHIH
jgi:hypothetical protein